ncbi:ABC-type multidrug transport system ATPase subunit [Actinoplanes campanulatus]|uniref:ABC-type multidrug transport system ATPase subunit n=1 Tax=Actinoplanes campanulatus TaxID=113559 RepID=A0A7W5FJ24_9ACTN|nr:ABC transporter ATP-binding protein [Actinoplanes campanulatus]MBB3100271.1 ABC-type multidrug transport system ATPase subunit [Actinoplanes campanulatus]GGN44119.1 ABC transporter ATP-binding protein [Actinoplanes campanulatus]GID40926.1 ABC transporter ATP-binding protein [Actinoplanes campanulatus]
MRIEISGLTKTYRGGVHAIDGLDLDIPTGMFGLLGANGAGKTTLMRILAGIVRPSAGRVVVGGHDIASGPGRTAVQRELGYLPQDLGVYPDLTARQFLDYVALLKGMDDRSARRRRVGELLEVVALTEYADRRLRGFSGGMRQRVGIAQALLADPRLLIVDEPTAGLDPEERIRFRTLLSQFAGRRTVLLSTHIVDDIGQTCREAAVLAKGRMIFRGTVEELTRRARGRVWEVVTDGPAPAEGTVVSALPHDDGMRYRVVARTAPSAQARPLDPSLEDGYLAVTADQAAAGREPASR